MSSFYSLLFTSTFLQDSLKRMVSIIDPYIKLTLEHELCWAYVIQSCLASVSVSVYICCHAITTGVQSWNHTETVHKSQSDCLLSNRSVWPIWPIFWDKVQIFLFCLDDRWISLQITNKVTSAIFKDLRLKLQLRSSTEQVIKIVALLQGSGNLV